MAVLAPLESATVRITPESFDAMCAEGRFGGVHVEMLNEGEIRVRVAQGPFHISVLMLLDDAVAPHLSGTGLRKLERGTVAFGRLRPEPDYALVRYDPRRPRLITSADVSFVAEVAVTSLETDRLAKVPIYAEGGVAEHWIVNPVARQVEVYREPQGRRYGSLRVAGEGETLGLIALPGVGIAVADLLPLAEEG